MREQTEESAYVCDCEHSLRHRDVERSSHHEEVLTTAVILDATITDYSAAAYKSCRNAQKTWEAKRFVDALRPVATS
jgi:hypothetical protein